MEKKYPILVKLLTFFIILLKLKMCKVSKDFKLCTCATEIDYSKDYWEYSAFVKGLNEDIVGMIAFPSDFHEPLTITNTKSITRILNKGNCFDFEIVPQENDHLHLYLNASQTVKDESVSISFKFKKGKWISFEPGLWEDVIEHETTMEGIIENGLVRE